MSLSNVVLKPRQTGGGKGGLVGKIVGGTAGAVGGFIAGGPGGAVTGAGIGSNVGGMLGNAADPAKFSEPRGVSSLEGAAKQNPYIDLDKLTETKNLLAQSTDLPAPEIESYTSMINQAIEAKKRILQGGGMNGTGTS